MIAAAPLPLSAAETMAHAVFALGAPTVAEAYSSFDTELLSFVEPQSIVGVAAANASRPNGAVHLAVHYPDTRGHLDVRKIALDPAARLGSTFRYSCEGWGLVYVYLAVGAPVGTPSFVSANSEKLGLAWAATHPELAPPDTLDWGAVGRHLRRLRSTLRRAA